MVATRPSNIGAVVQDHSRNLLYGEIYFCFSWKNVLKVGKDGLCLHLVSEDSFQFQDFHDAHGLNKS